MAYMSQEHKAKLAPTIKAICKKYGVKATLSVRNYSTLVLTVKSSGIDFIGNYNATVGSHSSTKDSIQVNPYWYHDHFDGVAKEFLDEIIPAMKGEDYFDESDVMTDYFHVSHYYDVNIGRWDKPYELTA